MARLDWLPRAREVDREVERSAVGGPRSIVMAWLLSAAIREPAYVWALTRVLFLVLTYFGVILFNDTLHAPTHPNFLHSFLPAWNRWDTWWYVEIARRGYAWKHAAGTSPTAFFPLYPLLIKLTVLISHRSYILAALIVSNLSFLAGLTYLWRLARWELSPNIASRTVLYVAVFPTALFFFAGYTESLFLFLTVASFYHMRRGDWILAGAFGAAAAATRVTGALLIIPFAYEYLRSHNFSLRRLDAGVLGLLLVPVGVVAFMVYLHSTVGDALAFTNSQQAWQKIFTPWLWSGFLESVRQIFDVQPRASFFEAHNVINVGLGGLFFTWSVAAVRRLPISYGLYLGVFWVTTLASPALAHGYEVPLISLSRYILALFPVFMYMGILGAHERFHNTYLVASTSVLALFVVQFLKGGWII